MNTLETARRLIAYKAVGRVKTAFATLPRAEAIAEARWALNVRDEGLARLAAGDTAYASYTVNGSDR